MFSDDPDMIWCAVESVGYIEGHSFCTLFCYRLLLFFGGGEGGVFFLFFWRG